MASSTAGRRTWDRSEVTGVLSTTIHTALVTAPEILGLIVALTAATTLVGGRTLLSAVREADLEDDPFGDDCLEQGS
jgi:hypothetical protein